MGMFDSLYKGDQEWQTKAYDCQLNSYRIGDSMPDVLGPNVPAPANYQVEILGDGGDTFATIRGGVLESIDVERDESLPRIDYWGAPDVAREI